MGVTTSRAEAGPAAPSSAMAKPLTPGQIAARMQGKVFQSFRMDQLMDQLYRLVWPDGQKLK